MQFLPVNFSRTGSYTTRQYSSASAFRLLFHSELESHLENLASATLNKVDAAVRAGQVCAGSSAVLSLYKSEAMGGMPVQISEIDTDPFLKKVQLRCINALSRKIEANKGVKSHNLLSLFIPLGVNEALIEEQLLIDLNTLGARRGDVAHKGLNGITALPDPKEEKILAERIITSLARFEELVDTVA